MTPAAYIAIAGLLISIVTTIYWFGRKLGRMEIRMEQLDTRDNTQQAVIDKLEREVTEQVALCEAKREVSGRTELPRQDGAPEKIGCPHE